MSRFIFNHSEVSDIVVRFENAIEDVCLCVIQGDYSDYNRALAELVMAYVDAINDCEV